MQICSRIRQVPGFPGGNPAQDLVRCLSYPSEHRYLHRLSNMQSHKQYLHTQLYKSKLAVHPLQYPSLLATSRESRNMAMNYYEIEFQVRVPILNYPATKPVTIEHPGFWFKHDLDRLVPHGFSKVNAIYDGSNRQSPTYFQSGDRYHQRVFQQSSER